MEVGGKEQKKGVRETIMFTIIIISSDVIAACMCKHVLGWSGGADTSHSNM